VYPVKIVSCSKKACGNSQWLSTKVPKLFSRTNSVSQVKILSWIFLVFAVHFALICAAPIASISEGVYYLGRSPI
jgi:hypothetical protein